MTDGAFPLDTTIDCLKSIAEPSRLRILRLLADSDLTVSDLTAILGQSQPRVSRHLKLLAETGLVRRWQEGSWALYRANAATSAGRMALDILRYADQGDDVLARDQERLAEVKAMRRARASDYFSRNAESWDRIRSLHAPDEQVEEALLAATGTGPFRSVLDIGTGTGRMLELYGPYCAAGVGIDANRDMLNVARSNLDGVGMTHLEVRQGDIYNLPFARDQFDLIIAHQVLHYLDDPQAAIREAARALAPSGRLVIVDFAAHGEESLREHHQHQRLGFADDAIRQWFVESDLEPSQPVTVAASGGEPANAPLSVVIWSATDQRYEVADTNPTPGNLKEAV